VNSHFFREGLVRPNAVDADAEYLRVQFLEILHVVHEADVLVGAGGTPIERGKHDDHILLTLIIGQLHLFLTLISQGEIGSSWSNRECHSSSSCLRQRDELKIAMTMNLASYHSRTAHREPSTGNHVRAFRLDRAIRRLLIFPFQSEGGIKVGKRFLR